MADVVLPGDDDVAWVVVAAGGSRAVLLEPAETGIDQVADGLTLDALAGVCERRAHNAAARPVGGDTSGGGGANDAPIQQEDASLLHIPGVPRRHVGAALRGIAGHHCLFATPVEATDEQRARWCQALFDGGAVHSLYFLPEPLAVCCAVGELGGARVVDLGHTGCRVSYVSHGSVQRFFLSRSLAASRFSVPSEDWAAFASTSDTAAAPPRTLATMRQKYLRALFPMGASAKGLPQLLERLPGRSRGTPVIVCGGGLGLAGPGLHGSIAAAVASMEASDSDSESSDESSSSDGPALKSKLLITRDPDEARMLVALGTSLFGAAGVEKVAISRAHYDATGPRVVLSKCPS